MGRLARFIRFYTDEDDGNGGEKFVLKTVTGTLLHILDALKKPAVEFSASLSPQQDLHGQEAPYPAGGGKNLLQVTASTQTVNDVTFTVNNDGTVTANGTASANIVFTIANISFASGSFLLNGTPSGGGTSSYYIRLYNTSTQNSRNSSTSDASFSADDGFNRVDIRVISGITVNNLVFKPMIRLSTESDATFAPYSNECPITGWTGANVTRTGKNLIKNIVYQASGTVVDLGQDSNSTFETYLKAGTYTIKYKTTGTTGSIYCRGENDSGNTGLGTVTETTFTITTDQNYRFWLYRSSGISASDIFEVQIEVGSTASTYEPYQGTTIPITFPDAAGTVYGCTLTNNGTDEWTLVVDRASVDLGTLTWTDTSWGGFRSNNLTQFKSNTDSSKVFSGISEKYKSSSNNAIANGEVGIIFGNSTRPNAFYIRSNEETTPSGLAVAELATPVTYTLTGQQAMTLLKGENNIWTDVNGQLSLTYKAQA